MSSTQQQPQKSIFRTGYNKASLDRYAYCTAATCCAYLLPHLESLPSSFTFLDIGCGPGSITTDLASRFPHAQFTGIDPGKLLLNKAKSLAQGRSVTANTTFQVGDVTSLEEVLGTQISTFDVMHCHQVPNHLTDPVTALKIMKAAAKSEGGIVAAREATTSDGDIFYPLLPGIKKWQELAATTMGSPESKTGPIPGFGPRLLETALNAGWARDKIHAGAGVWCYSEPDEKRMWVESMVWRLGNKESDWYKKNLAKGATEDDLAQMSEASRRRGMRAGASSSARRLSVEMDEHAVVYLTMLRSGDMPQKLHLPYTKSCSSGSVRLKLLFGNIMSRCLPFSPQLFSRHRLVNVSGWSIAVVIPSICPHLDFVSIYADQELLVSRDKLVRSNASHACQLQ